MKLIILVVVVLIALVIFGWWRFVSLGAAIAYILGGVTAFCLLRGLQWLLKGAP